MKVLYSLSLIAFALAIGGCAGKQQLPRDENNAFLQDYVLSKEGKADHELISFWKKGVVWQSYKKVIVDPVTVNVAAGSGLIRVAHAEKAQLRDKLEVRVRESLKPMFKLVKQADSETLRISLFITDIAVANALLASLQAIHPNNNTVLGLNRLVNGAEAFQGKSGVSGKITDATTGDVLMAVADQTEDDKIFNEFMILWGNVDKHYKYWAWQLGYRLCTQQQYKYCQHP